jgi:hypothetical protein
MIFEKKHDYEYPKGINLDPNSETHKNLLQALNDRIRRGYRTGQTMRDSWRKLDHLQTAYVPPDAHTSLDMQRDPKAPVRVVVPVSRASLDTMVAYAAGVFFGDPTGMYPLTARSSKEAIVRAAKMDRLLNAQAQWFQHKLSHFTSLRDTFLYGVSAKAPVWRKHIRKEPVPTEVTDVLFTLIREEMPELKIGDVIRVLEERVYHEGSYIENIDVYSLILDPHAGLNRYQESEFIGYWKRSNAMLLLRDEADDEMRLFNCKYVYDLTKSDNARSTTANWLQESGRHEMTDAGSSDMVPGSQESQTTNEVDIAYLFWRMIPSEWGIGDTDHPELWAFAVAGEQVIIQAYPLDYDHGMIPMVMDGPQTCGYDMLPVSSLAATYGLHQFIDWKVRMHYWNASRVHNSMFVIDGSMINSEDFRKGGPRQIIRLQRPLYGDGNIDKFIKQLQFHDMTNDYPNHVQALMQFSDYCVGTHAITQGDMSGMPERPTQWGLQAAQQAALSRLAKDCQVITEQSYYTLIRQMCHNNVQFLDNDMIVQILGSRYENQLREEIGLPPGVDDMVVSPWDLDMSSFEIEPLNRMQKETDMQAMSQMVDRMLSIPEVAMDAFGNMDVGRMFLSIIRKMGFENVHEFRKEGGQMPGMEAQILPDEQVMAMQQAGDIIPAGMM